MEKKIRLGAVNWDAGLPGNTYFGGYICPTLGADGKPNTAVLDGLARAIKKYN